MPNTKNYTNLEISRELKELGFKGECDAWWRVDITNEEVINLSNKIRPDIYEENIPAFTAQDILDVLPETIHCDNGDMVMCIVKEVDEVVCGYEYGSSFVFEKSSKTLADALGLMLIELIKKGIVKV